MKIASIDIGTNTCNLLIADCHGNSNLRFLHKEKRAITLINKNFRENNISDDSVRNLVNVLKEYKHTISTHNAEKILATATSGIRSAANRDKIINILQSETGISVNVIDGNKEAELAWQGVKNAVIIDEKPVLIIDIGGGSVEFVIGNNTGILWKKSYDIGVARLINLYSFTDPLSESDIERIYSVLEKEICTVFTNSKEFNVQKLIGSSGSFETFANLVKFECPDCKIGDITPSNTIDICRFMQIYTKLISFNEEQRTIMPGMELIRVKMIPVAAVITKFLLEKLNLTEFIQSNYSIKEGTLFDYVENHKCK